MTRNLEWITGYIRTFVRIVNKNDSKDLFAAVQNLIFNETIIILVSMENEARMWGEKNNKLRFFTKNRYLRVLSYNENLTYP